MNEHKLFNKIVVSRNKTKYDVVHSKLDKSFELSTNRTHNLITCMQFG